LRLPDLVAVLEGMPSIEKVIDDGELIDHQIKDRNIQNIPYIELIERDIGLEDHTSTSRNRQVTAEGRIIVFKRINNIKNILQEMEDVFKKNSANQFHANVNEPIEFSQRLWRIDFEVTYFETVSKVA